MKQNVLEMEFPLFVCVVMKDFNRSEFFHFRNPIKFECHYSLRYPRRRNTRLDHFCFLMDVTEHWERQCPRVYVSHKSWERKRTIALMKRERSRYLCTYSVRTTEKINKNERLRDEDFGILSHHSSD